VHARFYQEKVRGRTEKGEGHKRGLPNRILAPGDR
jgi:hypothetical protein